MIKFRNQYSSVLLTTSLWFVCVMGLLNCLLSMVSGVASQSYEGMFLLGG